MAKKGSRLFVWIILGFIFVGLIGFGSGGLSGNVRTLGTVGDKPVTVNQYAQALNQQIRAFEAQIGQPVSFPLAQSIGLDQSVLAQLIATRTLDNEAALLGLSAGDARVAAQVRQYPAFQGLDGAFNRDAYRESLSRNGLTEADFETGLREDMARTLLVGAVVGGVPAPDAYADALVAYIGARRSPTWWRITAAELSAPLPAPTEDEIAAQYEANPDTYTAPEVRSLTYAWLSPEMIQDDVVVDEQALRDLYQERIAEFVQPERRLVERLVMPDADAAAAARTALDAGETDFDALVADRGLDLSDVDLGDVGPADLGAAADAVFAAAPGDVVGPVDTALGPALFRMNAVLAAEEVTFEEARGDLREELAAARARRVIADAAEGLTDLLAGGASLEDLVERSDLQLGQIDWSEGQTDGIAAYDAFREAAAAATIGEFARPIELQDGGVFALRLDAVTPPTLQPLDAVRDRVIADRTAAATAEAVLAEAERLAGLLRDDPAALADLPAEGGAPLTRRDFVEGTPPDFMATVFAMEEGEVRATPGAAGAALVVRLGAVTAADPDDPAMMAERAAIAERAAGGIAQDINAAFTSAVQARTEVQINQSAINAVHSQFQ